MEHQYTLNGCSVQILSHSKSKKELIAEKIAILESRQNDDAFFVADLGEIIIKHQIWKKLLPRIQPFYAFKCNNEDAVLRVLTDLGVSFDCSSKIEIEKVLQLGVSPSRIIYAHPCKQMSFLRYAAKHNVKTMTFDNEPELYKVKEIFSDARLVLRILPPAGFKVMIPFGNKYGCLPRNAPQLLKKAKELDLNVVGISFHVGSGVEEADVFTLAVEQAHRVYKMAQEIGFNFELLDIGGGFPGHKNPVISFKEMAEELNSALDKYFPCDSGVEIIAEPGRYCVASAYALALNIVAKRVDVPETSSNGTEYSVEHTITSDLVSYDEPVYNYYVNDSIHGSFFYQLFCTHKFHPFSAKDDQDEEKYISRIWGHTCNGFDCILENCSLPELNFGDWIFYDDMGAYSTSVNSGFNGMPRPETFWYCSQENWNFLYPDEKKIE